jgi:hypothetical protein
VICVDVVGMMICVGTTCYAWRILQYAPLTFYLSVAHIEICATHNTGRGQASGAQVGPTDLSVAHYAQYAPLKGQICVAHIVNAPLISQDNLSTTLLVGPTDLLVAHF